MPPVLADNQACGPHVPGVFATEFGCSVFSSFESMSRTLPEDAWAPHAPVMFQRNYACDSIIAMYFGYQTDLNVTAGSAWLLQKATYLCMIGQALEMKSDIEHRRSSNAFGTITWQLNEIWPTGGWGSLEYGTVGWTPGQVLGGRWKPLHHWMAQHLYKSTISACGASGACYIKNDAGREMFTGAWTAALVDFASGAETIVARANVTLPRGAGSIAWVCAATGKATQGAPCPSYASIASQNNASTTSALLRLRLQRAGSQHTEDQNDVFMVPFAQIVAQPSFRSATVGMEVISQPDASGRYSVKLSTSGYSAFFVTLTTAAHGRFEENAFFLSRSESPKTVHFVPSPLAVFDADAWAQTTRVEHAGQYVA
jgi:hypothetical protein